MFLEMLLFLYFYVNFTKKLTKKQLKQHSNASRVLSINHKNLSIKFHLRRPHRKSRKKVINVNARDKKQFQIPKIIKR